MSKPTDIDFEFIETPDFPEPNFDKQEDCGVPTTRVRDIDHGDDV